MFKNTKVQMLLVLIAGTAIGYAAASGKLSPFPRAEAASGGQPAAAPKKDVTQPDTGPACCSEGATKGQLLALADPKVKAAVARAEEKGKKPNIVVIMGDDIGIWNIGA